MPVEDDDPLVTLGATYPGSDQTDNSELPPQNSVSSPAQIVEQLFCSTDTVEMLLSQ